MEIITANFGSYPRVGEGPQENRLRKKYQEKEEEKIGQEELEEVYRDYSRKIIKEQESIGIDIVTDGLIRWYDPISHFGKNVKNCKIDGLKRFFDTNFYYRQPLIKGSIDRDGPTVLDEFQIARRYTSNELKPVLTGPFTLSDLSINEHYEDFESLVYDWGKILAEEVRDLSSSGAKKIQINEPKILKKSEYFDLFNSVMEDIEKANEGSDLFLYTYFGDSSNIYSDLQDLPVDLLGFDFFYGSNISEKIEEYGTEKYLGLGLINGRTTVMEEKEKVISKVENLMSFIDKDKIYLNPSCGMEYLPRNVAFKKLKNMVEISKELRRKIK